MEIDIRNLSKQCKNAYIVAIFACCREVYISSMHCTCFGGKNVEEATEAFSILALDEKRKEEEKLSLEN